jgi:hypothetical protein
MLRLAVKHLIGKKLHHLHYIPVKKNCARSTRVLPLLIGFVGRSRSINLEKMRFSILIMGALQPSASGMAKSSESDVTAEAQPLRGPSSKDSRIRTNYGS